MKLLILTLFTFFSLSTWAENLSVACTDFVGKSKMIRGCGVVGFNFEIISKEIAKKIGPDFTQLRLIGWDEKSNSAFLAASKKTLLEKICYSDLDSIIRINIKTNSIEQLWDTKAQINDVLDNMNTMTVLKHSMVKNSSEAHNCDPLLFINKVSRVGSNLGSRYNALLNENNNILIPGIGHSTIYFFSSDFKKLLGSFFITEPQNLLIDAIVSEKGTIFALLRDMPKQQICVVEFELESGNMIKKKCAPKNLELTYLSRGKHPYIFTREFQKGEKIISIKDWFAGVYKFYDFKPNAFYPQYFFPHMQIESE